MHPALSQNPSRQNSTLPLRATHDMIGCLHCAGRMGRRARRTACTAVSFGVKLTAQRPAAPSRCCNATWPHHDGNTITNKCTERCKLCRQDSRGVTGCTNMRNGEGLLDPSNGRERKSGTTLSGPGTYLISLKLYSARKSHRRRIRSEGDFCMKRNCRLS